MSTAIAPEEVISFKAPDVCIGQSVQYWLSGDANDGSRPCMGFVLRIGNNKVTLQIPGIGAKEGVRHADDPRLKQNDYSREEGCWDFPTETRQVRAKMKDLENQIVQLRKDVAALTTKAAKGQ